MTQSQTAINAAAARWLTDLLERLGLTGDVSAEAEHICRELLALGLAPVPRPYPLRPSTPAASDETRTRAREAVADAVRDAKVKGGRA